MSTGKPITSSLGHTEPLAGAPDEVDSSIQHASQHSPPQEGSDYRLDEQVGYLLRLANQRHLEIFNHELPSLTPAQLAVLARLLEQDGISQNELGRRVGMDAATIKGIIDRLCRKELVCTKTDVNDKRLLLIDLTPAGRQLIQEVIPLAQKITKLTLDGLNPHESKQLIQLLKKLQHAH